MENLEQYFDNYTEEIVEEVIENQPEEPINVYVQINSKNEIIRVNSDAFIDDFSDWIKIDSGFGDKFRLAQNNYFDKPLINEDGSYNYNYINGMVRLNK